MNNKTILISDNNKGSSLTNFHKVNMNPHDDFHKQTSTFRKNNLKAKAYEYEISFNPLINAASPLIKYVLEIGEINDIELNVDEIKEGCISRINLFGETALNHGIDNTEVLVTRYILCTFVDELLNIYLSHTNVSWSSNSLLNIFHRETYGGENFFHLLDKFLKTSAKYIHILELMYICLALGFEGKYRVIDRGQIELNNIKGSLYKQIKIVQGRDPYTFYSYQEPSKDKYRLFNKISYSLLFLGVFLLLTVIYSILSLNLNDRNSDFIDIVKNKKEMITSIEGMN